MDLNRCLALWAGLLLLGLSSPAHAHNGAMAIAVPVEGIEVDGDLSDWPAGMRRYPIALPEYGDKPKGPEDFQGSFRIGYNAQENALYVAVEVQDESVVKDTQEGVRWDTQDGCEVYVDVSHKEEDVPVLQYVIWGNTRAADPVYSVGTLADMKVEVKWGERGYRYEWRIDVGQLSKGQEHLKPGTGIAFDMTLWDKDQDGSATWMAWGPGTDKYGHSARLGWVSLAVGERESGDSSVMEVEQAETVPQIDGDTDEWPEAQWHHFAPGAPHVSKDPRNQLLNDGTTEPPGTAGTAADLSGSFALQWDDDWLYLAARVRDNAHDVQWSGAGRQMGLEDAVSLFLDIPLDGDGPACITGDHAFTFLADPSGRADGKWWRYGDNTKQPVVQEVLAPPETRLAVRPGAGGDYTIEAAIPMAALTKLTPAFHAPLAGRMVGFMFLVADPDGGPEDWGGQIIYGGDDDNDANWMRLRLRPGGATALQMGRIEGKVKWEDREEGKRFGKVRFQSLTSADFWVQVQTDSQGAYTAELPVGKYRVEAGYWYQKTATEVEVKAEETAQVAEVSFARPPPPVLARLSFWVPPGRMEEFAAEYEGKIVPVLDRYGLVPSSVQGRPTVPEVFSRLFEFERPEEVDRARNALWQDSEYQENLHRLWQKFRTDLPANLFAPGAQPVSRPAWYPFGFSTDQLRKFEGVHDMLAITLAKIFSELLGFPVGMETVFLDQTTLAEYIHSLSDPSWTYAFHVEPLGRPAVMTISSRVADTFIRRTMTAPDTKHDALEGLENKEDLRAGSMGRGPLAPHTMTALECGIMEQVASHVFSDLEKTWEKHLTKIQVSNVELETDPGKLDVVDVDDLVILVALQVASPNGTGLITFCYPFIALEPVLGLVPSRLTLYETSAEWGKTVPAGAGRAVTDLQTGGHWRSYSAGDGLTDSTVSAIYQDRDGIMWFGTTKGVSRFDGAEWRTFTSTDGLAGNVVSSIYQDREGNMWFGTTKGVSRFDGTAFETFTRADGLPHALVYSIYQDQEARIWFGTAGGACRFDGTAFEKFTVADGLPHDQVLAISEDGTGHLWFGTAAGACRFDGKRFENADAPQGLYGNSIWAIHRDRHGTLWFGTSAGIVCYDGNSFMSFAGESGTAGRSVYALFEDDEGQMWFGTHGGGVIHYDGKRWTVLSTRDGLTSNYVLSISQDREGHLWFGTQGSGASQYDARTWTSFVFSGKTGAQKGAKVALFVDPQEGASSGLLAGARERAKSNVQTGFQDAQGQMWFGRGWGWQGDGLLRYDGHSWTTFSLEDGLVYNNSNTIFEDRKGDLWFGGWSGLTRYDGRTFTSFPVSAHDIFQDRDGNLWFAGHGGVAEYVGKRWTWYIREDGLSSSDVESVLQDREGSMWFGTYVGGLSQFDGRAFTTVNAHDGLGHNDIHSIFQDREGILWFGTGVPFRPEQRTSSLTRYADGRFQTFTAIEELKDHEVGSIYQTQDGHLWFGRFRYDGEVYQEFSPEDGLASSAVNAVFQDREGHVWFATEGGITRYSPPTPHPPRISIDAVEADRRYERASKVSLPTGTSPIAFEFRGASFKTRPGKIVYRYRLRGYDEAWKTTRLRRVEYKDLPRGDYTFEVQAVDRDLVYSEKPALVELEIHLPYGQVALTSGLVLSLLGLVFASGTAIRRRRAFLREQTARLAAQEALNKELEEELQTAHTLQMDLMPRESPQIPGFDLAGRCIPANHVGGDLFQYFHQDNKLSIALADVTGHAMEAAIPMVMFSGVLKSQIEISGPIEELFGRLNRSLHHAAGSRTFVCFAFGTIDTRTHALRLSSAAFPYPYHFSASTGKIAELQVDSYPLGVRPDTNYTAIERQLAPGDYLVFCSDGIIEATDGTGAQFGYEHTAATLRSGCAAGLSAEALLERIVAEVRAFRGETPQGDDQTVVVLRVDDGRSA